MTLIGCRLKQLGMFCAVPIAGTVLMCVLVAALFGTWIGILFMQPVQVNKGRYKLKWRM